MLIYQRVSLARNLPHILAKVYLDQLEHHILNTQPSHVLIIAGPETPVMVYGLICSSTSELLESFQLSYRTGAPARELIVLDLLQPPQKKEHNIFPIDSPNGVFPTGNIKTSPSIRSTWWDAQKYSKVWSQKRAKLEI